MTPMNQVSDTSALSAAAASSSDAAAAQSQMQTEEPGVTLQSLQYTARIYTQAQQLQQQQQAAGVFRNNV